MTENNWLSDWIVHLEDQDSTGAWNENDTKIFDQIIKDKDKLDKIKEYVNGKHTTTEWDHLVEKLKEILK